MMDVCAVFTSEQSAHERVDARTQFIHVGLDIIDSFYNHYSEIGKYLEDIQAILSLVLPLSAPVDIKCSWLWG